MKNGSKPRVLYMVYWGAAEPLGQSLVLPAVKRLAALGAELTLVTFEKPDDLARHSAMADIRSDLERHGIEWIALRYHKTPKVPATLYDILRGVASGVVARLRTRPDIIHARTFIGGLIGLTLAPLVGARLIYHNEGFYPDEQVDCGVWKKGSGTHRIASLFEQQMYARADAIITISHRGKRIIERFPAVQRKGSPVIVVPSCVDLDAFRRSQPRASIRSGTLCLAYVGSVGGRYLLDKVGRFVEIASREFDSVHLRVLTRAEPSLVASMLSAGGLTDDKWSVGSVPHDAMPAHLADQDAGLDFLAQGLSEHACSPTKIGEYWAMGLPVVTTPNISDTDEIIRRERVGIIVAENSDDAFHRAARELKTLLEDKELPARCRRAAEEHYALEPACERQLDLYHKLSEKGSRQGDRDIESSWSA